MRLPRLAAGVARPRRLLLHSLAMGALITLLMASGTGSTFAVWTSQATATTTASGAQLDVTTSFANANAVFADHVLSSTGSFTIGNATDTTSTTPGSYTATLGYTGDSALASALALTVWPYSVAAPCTAAATPAGVVATGTWAAVTGVISGTLAAPGSITYCLRMTASERSDLATADGELLINPSVTATLSVGNWTDTASATTVQKTAYVFPVFTPTASTWYQVKNVGTGLCVDVHGAETAVGTGVIDYACKTGNAAGDYNQHWKFSPTDTGYYTLTPRNVPTLLMDVVGQSAGTLAPIDVQTATSNPIRDSQEWQLQVKPNGNYQLVNRLSGLCLEPHNTAVYAGDTEYAQAVCDGTADQSFSLTLKTTVTPTMTQVACAPSGSGVTYSWTGAAVDAYDFQVGSTPSGAFTTVTTAPVGSTSVTILPADLATQTAGGKYSVRSYWNNTTLAPTGSVPLSLWKATNGGVTTLHCAPDSDIAVTATVNPTSIDQNVAGTATWTVSAVNNGPLPSSGTLTLTLPATTGYPVTPSGACTGTGATRTCAFSSLPVGSSLTVTVTRTIPANQPAGSLTVTGVAAVTAASNTDPVAANNSASAALTIVDREAPTVPGRPSANATGATGTTLTWSASSDNVGVTAYDVYRDGTLIASVGASPRSFTDTNLMSGTSYVYTVKARDAVGNPSGTSASRTVVTASSGKIISGAGGSDRCIRIDGTEVELASCYGSGREWIFSPSSDGFVKISSSAALSLALAATVSGVGVTTSTMSPETTAQEWTMTPSGSGYTFESRSRPGLCLQRNSSSVVGLATCNASSSSQVWAVD